MGDRSRKTGCNPRRSPTLIAYPSSNKLQRPHSFKPKHVLSEAKSSTAVLDSSEDVVPGLLGAHNWSRHVGSLRRHTSHIQPCDPTTSKPHHHNHRCSLHDGAAGQRLYEVIRWVLELWTAKVLDSFHFGTL